MVPVQQNDRVFVGKEYIVEANDSLQSIAHRFGTSEENLVSVFMQASSQDCSIHPFHCFTTRNSPYLSVTHQRRFGAECTPITWKCYLRNIKPLCFCKLSLISIYVANAANALRSMSKMKHYLTLHWFCLRSRGIMGSRLINGANSRRHFASIYAFNSLRL